MPMADFNKFMNQFVPMLVQQMLQDQALQRKVKGYEAWGTTQKDIMAQQLQNVLQQQSQWGSIQEQQQQRAAQNTLFENMMEFGKEYFKNQPYAFAQFTNFLKQYFPPEMVGQFPEMQATPDMGETQQMLGTALAAMQSGQEIPPEVYTKLAEAFGFKPAYEIGEKATSRMTGIEERAVQTTGQEVERGKTKVRYAELAGKGATDTLEALEDLEDDLETLFEKEAKVGVEQQVKQPKLSDTYRSQILDKIKKVKKARDKNDIPDEKVYKNIADDLKSKGWKIDHFINNEQGIQDALLQKGLLPWRVLIYW